MDDRLREELNALVDGELDAARAAELRRRMETDAALRREYESLRRTAEAVRGLPRPPAPSELRARIASSLPGGASARRPGRLLALRPWMAAAAVVLVAVAGAYLARDTRPQTGPATQEAVKEKDGRRGTLEEQAKPLGASAEADALEAADAGADEGAAVLDDDAPAKGAEFRERDAATAKSAVPAPAAPAAQTERRVGAPAKEELERPGDIVEQVEIAGVLPETDRPLYLRRLGDMPAAEVRAHIFRVAPAQPSFAAQAADSAWIQLAAPDRETAAQVYNVLAKLQPAPVPGAGALAAGVPAPQPQEFAFVATVEGTEVDLRRIQGWLLTLRGPAERKQEDARSLRGGAKAARAEAEAAGDAGAVEEGGAAGGGPKGADPEAKRVARIRITWPPPPAAESAPPADGGK